MAGTKLIKPKKGKKALTSVDVQYKLLELDCDPIEIMASIALSSKADDGLRLSAAKELAGYMYSKQRSVDISAEMTTTNIDVRMSGDKALQAIRDLTGHAVKTIEADVVEVLEEKDVDSDG